MKKFLISIMLILPSISLFGQFEQERALQRENILNTQTNETFRGKRLTDATIYDSDFDKNPLLFRFWVLGAISFEDHKEADSVYLNYDTKLNSIVFKLKPEFSPLTVDAKQVSGFTIYENNSVFEKGEKSEFEDIEEELIFFQTLYKSENNTISLIKYEFKRVLPAAGQLQYTSAPEDKYLSKTSYFTKQGENVYQEFSFNKKGVKDLSSKNQFEEIQSFVKENKLKWSDEADMIKIFQKFF